MDTRIEAQTDIARNRRWPVADGEIFVNVTGPLGLAGPVLVHLAGALHFGAGRAPERPFDPFINRHHDDTPWGLHLAELLGGQPSVVLSVPLPETDRAKTAFIDIDGKNLCVSLGATTKRARAALRAVIIEALDDIVTPADERGAS